MRAVFRFKSQLLVALLVGAVCSAGCSDDETAPTTPSPTTSSVTWQTNLATAGASSRSFTTTRSGTVSITLQRLGTSTEMRAGLGVGIPLADGSGCVLSRSVETVPGSTAQLELDVDAGDYCVQVYDLGELTSAAAFTVVLVYPIAAS
jgi:hypothetical protein